MRPGGGGKPVGAALALAVVVAAAQGVHDAPQESVDDDA